MKKASRKKTTASLEVGDRLPFGELAMLMGYITREHLGAALRDQVLRDQKIATILIQSGHLTKDQAKTLLKIQKKNGPIDGFLLKQRIGAGGMGTVYRATQTSLNRTVAIKILNRDAAGNETQRKRFIQEAHLLAQLQHPNLIQCIDIGESNELIFLIMEFVDGRNAREILLHDGPYEEEYALDIMDQCLQAMMHYHEKAIIHRDIKPENILISMNHIAKITDLGLSKQLTNDLFLTRVGKTVGTPYYISPELARGQSDVDIRTDIYSLAASFYHLATGFPPFDGDSAGEILTKHVKDPPPKPSSHNPKLSKSFDALLMRMLEKHPKKRYSSPDEVLRDVKSLRETGRLEGSGNSRRRRPTTTSMPAVRQSGVRSSGVRPGPRSSGVTRGARSRGPRSSGTRTNRTNNRGSGVRSTSGVQRRQSPAGVGRPGRQSNGLAGIGALVFGLVVVIAVGFGYFAGKRNSNANGSSGNKVSYQAEHDKLLADLQANPREAVMNLEVWASQADDKAEVVKRWSLVLDHKKHLNGEFQDRAAQALDRAKRDFEAEASDALDRLRDEFYKLSDAGKKTEAKALLDDFPKKYESTTAWKSLDSLRSEITGQ